MLAEGRDGGGWAAKEEADSEGRAGGGEEREGNVAADSCVCARTRVFPRISVCLSVSFMCMLTENVVGVIGGAHAGSG